MQLVDQTGPPGFDRLVHDDLAADDNAKLSARLIAGSGVAGPGVGAADLNGHDRDYTSATPTVAGTMSKIVTWRRR